MMLDIISARFVQEHLIGVMAHSGLERLLDAQHLGRAFAWTDLAVW